MQDSSPALVTFLDMKDVWQDYILAFLDCDDVFVISNVIPVSEKHIKTHMLDNYQEFYREASQDYCPCKHRPNMYRCPHRASTRYLFRYERRYGSCCEVWENVDLDLCFLCYTYGISTFFQCEQQLPFLRCHGRSVCNLLLGWFDNVLKQLVWSHSRTFLTWLREAKTLPKSFYCKYYARDKNNKIFRPVLLT